MKKIINICLSFAIVLVSITGLIQPEKAHAATGEGQEIVFWHGMGGNTGVALEKLVKKFNEENKQNIKVKAEYQGSYDDTITKLRSASLGNMEADLVQIYDIGTRYMIDSGLVKPFQEFIDADNYDISQIEPNIAAYYSIDGKLISMPFNSSTPILYYNKDVFEKAGIKEAPKSLKEMADLKEPLEKAGVKMPISLQVYGWFVEQLIAKEGKQFVNNNNGREDYATEVAFNDGDTLVNILKEWKALEDAGVAPNVGREGGQPEFVSGTSAMTIGSTANLSSILSEVGGKFEVGTAYFPSVSGNETGGVSIGGASLWAMDNQDEEKAAAVWEFTKFLIAPENQAEWNKETGYFPITTATHDEPVFKENIESHPQFKTAIDQLHDSTPESQGALLSVFPEARQIVESEIENMLNGGTTPEEAAKKITKQINSAIEQYNLVNY